MKRSKTKDVKWSEVTRALLAAKVEELHQSNAEEAMEAIFILVVQHEHDEAYKNLFVSVGAIEAIVETVRLSVRRPSASPQLLHRALGVLSYLSENSRERSSLVIDKGGLDCSLEIMQRFPYFPFLLITCMLLHSALLRSVPDEKRPHFAEGIFLATVIAMENEQDGTLFTHACVILGICSGPGVYIHAELVNRAVQSAFDGVVLHVHNQEAQTSGHNVLIYLMGPEAARRMMDHAEMHHSEDVDFSRAA